jgi:hypothetical protein
LRWKEQGSAVCGSNNSGNSVGTATTAGADNGGKKRGSGKDRQQSNKKQQQWRWRWRQRRQWRQRQQPWQWQWLRGWQWGQRLQHCGSHVSSNSGAHWGRGGSQCGLAYSPWQKDLVSDGRQWISQRGEPAEGGGLYLCNILEHQ